MKVKRICHCWCQSNLFFSIYHSNRMKLFAVVSHTGYTTSSGHYRAYINSSIKDIHNLPASLNPEPSDISISANPNLEYISPPSLSNQHNLSRNEQPLPWIELDDHQAKRLLSEDLERITGTGYSFNTPNMLFYSRTFWVNCLNLIFDLFRLISVTNLGQWILYNQTCWNKLYKNFSVVCKWK